LLPDDLRVADCVCFGRESRGFSCFGSGDTSIPSSDTKSDQPPTASLAVGVSECASDSSFGAPAEASSVGEVVSRSEPAVVTDCVAAFDLPTDGFSSATLGAAALEPPNPGRIWGGILAFNASKMLPALLCVDAVVGTGVVGEESAGADCFDSLGVFAPLEVADLAGSLLTGSASCFSSAGGSETPGVSSSFARMFQLSFIFIEDYFCS
jgi:hypothetical protein